MRKISFFIIALLLLSLELNAQTYTTTGGIRIGNSVGLTVNQRILKRTSLEGILQNDFNKNTYFHVLGRQHSPLITRRANVYYGGGVHFGVQDGTTSVAGIDAVLGIEMTLLRLNISGDLKPQLTSGPGRNLTLNGAVSVRYVLVQDNVFKKWEKQRQKKRRQKERQKKREEGGGILKDIFN